MQLRKLDREYNKCIAADMSEQLENFETSTPNLDKIKQEIADRNSGSVPQEQNAEDTIPANNGGFTQLETDSDSDEDAFAGIEAQYHQFDQSDEENQENIDEGEKNVPAETVATESKSEAKSQPEDKTGPEDGEKDTTDTKPVIDSEQSAEQKSADLKKFGDDLKKIDFKPPDWAKK